jgi:AcrR family transcriptional regulator
MKPPPRVLIAGSRAEVDKAVKAIFARVPPKSAFDDAADMFQRLRATPPKQERSLQTLNRLLDAAEKVLEEKGLDAATVPVIARRAGVSVGVVYRRFANKDALIRGVYERFLWRIGEQNSMMFATLSRVHVSLSDLLRGMVRGSVESHRRKRNLLRALFQFARTHSDPAMKREAGKMNRASTAALTALMLSHREKITHPDPETAIEFAVLTLASVIRAAIIDDAETHGLSAPDDLEDELTRMIFGYLGIDERR